MTVDIQRIEEFYEFVDQLRERLVNHVDQAERDESAYSRRDLIRLSRLAGLADQVYDVVDSMLNAISFLEADDLIDIPLAADPDAVDA